MEERKPTVPTALLLEFIPERWGEVERFVRFYRTTYQFDRQVSKRLSGILGHFDKAHRLFALAQRLEPTMDEDEKQIEAEGYTPAYRSKEVAAIVETIFCSLYSTLDCFRHVFMGVYPNLRGVKASTRGLFQKGYEGTLDGALPVSIRNAFLPTKSWFVELLRLRDELTHSEIGSCHRDRTTGQLTYMHPTLGTPTCALVEPDVFAKIQHLSKSINSFLGCVFKELNSTLKDVETEQFCGIFGGRWYSRSVRPSEAVDFHAGRCKSFEWFDKDGNPPCPLKSDCGAYIRNRAVDGKS